MGGLVDEEGKLFGVVNVVDALVLLLILAILVGSVGLVIGIDDTEPAQTAETETAFVTLDLGTQPDYIVATLDEGDTYTPGNGSSMTVTDLYRAPQDSQTRVVARARLEGTTSNGSLEYANAPARLGRSLEVKTDTYNITGRITDVGDGSSLNENTTTVVVQDTLSAADADAIAPGDEITVAGRTTATIDEVAIYPTNDTNRRRVLVEATLATHTQRNVRRFGGTALRRGEQVTLPGPGYTFDGRIERVDGGLESDSLVNRTVTLELTKVQPQIASTIRAGQTERDGGRTTATVTGVSTEPTQVVSTAQNGSVVVSDHPVLRDVTLTTELRVRETSAGIEFRGERIQHGSTVVLDLDTATIRTTVISIEQ